MFNKVAKQQLSLKEHKAKGSYTWQCNEEMNFLYENNLPKDLKSKRSVASFAMIHHLAFFVTRPCEGLHSSKLNSANH